MGSSSPTNVAGGPDIRSGTTNSDSIVSIITTSLRPGPFYFAPRSPMMFKIWKGQVVGYSGGLDPIIYLVTSLQVLVAEVLTIVVTDGNAANAPTRFSANSADVDELVDWPLMRAAMWRNRADDPDRMRRRMAECLVRGRVPFSVF